MSISCSEYSEILKSDDYDKKFEAAKSYYEEKEYFKAETLFKELLTVYKGTKKAEEIYYFYAYCQYGLNDYDFAAFHFKNFVKNFSGSERAEEMHYMIPVCYSKMSPESSLDQSNTRKAIEEFQLFLDKYPSSKRRLDANKEVDLLRDKLESKAYDLAYLYYKVGDYKAAIIALKNVIKDFPDIDNAEEIRFYVVESSYLLAQLSIDSKKRERYLGVLEEAKVFNAKHKDSKYSEKVESYKKKAEKLAFSWASNYFSNGQFEKAYKAYKAVNADFPKSGKVEKNILSSLESVYLFAVNTDLEKRKEVIVLANKELKSFGTVDYSESNDSSEFVDVKGKIESLALNYAKELQRKKSFDEAIEEYKVLLKGANEAEAKEIAFLIIQCEFLKAKSESDKRNKSGYAKVLVEISNYTDTYKETDYQKQLDNYSKLCKKALSLQD